jgi:hypothetical protein
MTVKIAQEAKPQDKTYWQWSVWLEGTNDELDDVEEVIWKLHPTFVNPVQRVTSRKTKFKLSTSGWGEFQVVAEVRRKRGKNQKLRHWLRFAESSADAGTGAKRKSAPAKASKKIKGRFSGPKPKVFISYTRENAQLAGYLTKMLEGHDVEVSRDLDVKPGMDVHRWISQAIVESDAMVVLVPAHETSWANLEIKTAMSAEVNIIPVVSDPSVKLPTALKEYHAIKIKPGNPELIAENLAEQVTGLL